jgi:hypothetical protein
MDEGEYAKRDPRIEGIKPHTKEELVVLAERRGSTNSSNRNDAAFEMCSDRSSRRRRQHKDEGWPPLRLPPSREGADLLRRVLANARVDVAVVEGTDRRDPQSQPCLDCGNGPLAGWRSEQRDTLRSTQKPRRDGVWPPFWAQATPVTRRHGAHAR